MQRVPSSLSYSMCSTLATPDDITVTTFYKMAAGGHVEQLPKKQKSYKRNTVKVVLNTSLM